MRTYYDDLNLAENAPQELIRAAHAALAARCQDGGTASGQSLRMLDEAYGVLADPQRRAEYDRLLLSTRASLPPPAPAPVSAPAPAIPPLAGKSLPERAGSPVWPGIRRFLIARRFTLFLLLYAAAGFILLYLSKTR